MVIAALSFVLSVLCAHDVGARQATASAKTYRIAGHVLSAQDGHALAGATVTLAVAQSGDRVSSVTAGDDGTFLFEGLTAGKYSLFGLRRGFISAGYREHEQYSTAIVTGAGLDTEHLDLPLQPEASITGRVLDESGEPVRNAQVSLYSERRDTGRKQIRNYSTTVTDDLGNYSFDFLPAGNYFVVVKAQPWYAVRSLPADPQALFPGGVDPALDVAYPMTFYGDGIKEDAAASIPLKAGKRLRADVRLLPVRAVRIKVGVPSGSQTTMVSSLRTPVFDSFEEVPYAAQTNVSGENEVVGLAPRRYEFVAIEQGPEPRPPQSGELDLTQGSAEVDPQHTVVNGSLVLSIVQENGEKLPADALVMLGGRRPVANDRQGINADGAATFTSLPPGDYHFLVYVGGRAWQTLRIDEGDKHFAQDHWSLAAGETATLKLTVAGTAKAVEGTAVRDGKPIAGAMIVLAPVDALDNPDLFRRDQSDLDGTFALLNVPAGRYIVIAIDDGWKLEWGKPEVLTRFLLKGTAVAVPATQREPFHLPGTVTVQEP